MGGTDPGLLFFVRPLAATFAILGLLAGLAYALGGFFMELSSGTLNAGSALAFLAILGMPCLFALAGALLGLVVGVAYRLLPAWLVGRKGH